MFRFSVGKMLRAVGFDGDRVSFVRRKLPSVCGHGGRIAIGGEVGLLCIKKE